MNESALTIGDSHLVPFSFQLLDGYLIPLLEHRLDLMFDSGTARRFATGVPKTTAFFSAVSQFESSIIRIACSKQTGRKKSLALNIGPIYHKALSAHNIFPPKTAHAKKKPAGENCSGGLLSDLERLYFAGRL